MKGLYQGRHRAFQNTNRASHRVLQACLLLLLPLAAAVFADGVSTQILGFGLLVLGACVLVLLAGITSALVTRTRKHQQEVDTLCRKHETNRHGHK